MPKRGRGGQPGNQNSKGHKNAAGSHKGRTAAKQKRREDGAYSIVFFDVLMDEEKAMIEQTQLGSRAALAHEMKILKFRDDKALTKIADSLRDRHFLHLDLK